MLSATVIWTAVVVAGCLAGFAFPARRGGARGREPRWTME